MNPSHPEKPLNQQTPASQDSVESAVEFVAWLDRELQTLLDKNTEWQTKVSLRKYFGR